MMIFRFVQRFLVDRKLLVLCVWAYGHGSYLVAALWRARYIFFATHSL